MDNFDINKINEIANCDDIILKRRENRMLLSDYQVSVLKRNGIDYNNYSNFSQLLFDIEDVLNHDYDDELDLVGSQIAEIVYYSETKK